MWCCCGCLAWFPGCLRAVTGAPQEDPPADPRDALIREQAERIAALEALVADLRGQLAAAQRAGSRNSGNSSMPPSSDDLPGRKAPRKQRRAAERAEKKRKRGKQPGSPGAAMAWEVPDRAEDHYPQGDCACGLDLADAADLGVARSYQKEGIPVSSAERVQHDLHEAKCACGRTHVAARPAGVPDSALSIGPRLRALAVYLVVFQHVPVERCRDLIADVTGAAVSAGFIHSCLAQAAGLAADVVRLIRTLITAAPVAGFDETTLRSGPAGEKKYVHGAFTERYSAFWLGTRGLDSMQDAGIIPGGSTSPGTRRACLTYCVISRTAPRATPAPSGPCRRSGRCAASSMPGTPPASRTWTPSPPTRGNRWSTSSGTPSWPAWPACPASRARRTARSRSQAASCWNSAVTAAATCCCSPRTPACGRRTTSAKEASGP